VQVSVGAGRSRGEAWLLCGLPWCVDLSFPLLTVIVRSSTVRHLVLLSQKVHVRWEFRRKELDTASRYIVRKS